MRARTHNNNNNNNDDFCIEIFLWQKINGGTRLIKRIAFAFSSSSSSCSDSDFIDCVDDNNISDTYRDEDNK